MSDGAIEIITGKERRRRWGLEEKLRIVAETQEPDASIREVAARHDVLPEPAAQLAASGARGPACGDPAGELCAGPHCRDGTDRCRDIAVGRLGGLFSEMPPGAGAG
jgi:hypothetical protein